MRDVSCRQLRFCTIVTTPRNLYTRNNLVLAKMNSLHVHFNFFGIVFAITSILKNVITVETYLEQQFITYARDSGKKYLNVANCAKFWKLMRDFEKKTERALWNVSVQYSV